jgi:methylthioribose-1-phosphate isomerase
MGLIRAIEWTQDHVQLLDQTRLPEEEVYLHINTPEAMAEAIRTLRVRGAPAIGIAGAFGVVLAARQCQHLPPEEFIKKVRQSAHQILQTRPTAVNLQWAIQRCLERLDPDRDPAENTQLLLKEAKDILREDQNLCERIGKHGADFLEHHFSPPFSILTHCNTGVLATGGRGTALSIIYELKERGHEVVVYADETRPLLQGARLTAWELSKADIPVTLICDNMAAALMNEKKIQCVIVGADRIAANGDTANKIGTLGLAILAKHFKIPFYIAAPYSTFDFSIENGRQIPIEERPIEEIFSIKGLRIAPQGIAAWNPAFDVTPAEQIAAFFTDHGVILKPFLQSIKEMKLKLDKRERSF